MSDDPRTGFASWVEVDLGHLEYNYNELRSLLPSQVRIMAVVKADAYGLGAEQVALLYEELGVDYLAVTYVEEGLRLRGAGVACPVLVFAPASPQEVAAAIEEGLTLTVASRADYLMIREGAERTGLTARVHLKVDTGLSRFGLEPAEAVEVASQINSEAAMELEGIYTHFANAADKSDQITREQFRRFMGAVSRIEGAGINVKLKHCCNSAATLRFPDMHLDMIRVGTLLFGQYPAGYVPRTLRLADPFCFKSRVVAVRELPPGRRIGYGGTYRTRKHTRIGVVPVGYVDGLGVSPATHPGSLPDLVKWIARLILTYLGHSRVQLHAVAGGLSCPVRGKVFMQMAIIELPLAGGLVPGEEVILPVRRTMVSLEVPRVYLRAGNVVAARASGLEANCGFPIPD